MRGCIDFIIYVLAGALVCRLMVKAQSIRGIPGVDYPNYFSIPKTNFKCSDQKFIPGFYADMETDCQVFHFCYSHRQESFLCPTGTTFNQPILACDSWYSSNCSLASLYYIVNGGPGIANAGKNIPMLLKLKDRAQDAFSTLPSTTNVFEHISSLYDSSTEPKDPSKDAPEVMVSGNLADVQNALDVKNESESVPKISDSMLLNADNASNFDPTADSDENYKKNEHQKAGKESHEMPNVSGSVLSEDNFTPEHAETDFVFDTVTDGYYMGGFDSSDPRWQDDSQSEDQFQSFYEYGSDISSDMMRHESVVSDENQNFYEYRSGDYDNQGFQNLESAQVQDGYIKNQYNDAAAEDLDFQSEDVQRNLNSEGQDKPNSMEFSKRYMQGVIPKRSRRRPTYVVVEDEPNIGFPHRIGHGMPYQPTESPFTELISIDSLVEELNTEFPTNSHENVETSDELNVNSWEGNADDSSYADTFEPLEEFEGGTNSDMRSKTVSEMSDQGFEDIADAEASDINGGSLTAESREVTELKDDQSVYAENEEYNDQFVSSDSQDFAEEFETGDDVREEDILIYDDSDDPVVPDEASEQEGEPNVSMDNEADNTFIVIPDESDSKTYDGFSPESTPYDTVSDSLNRDLAYSNMDGSLNADSETNYLYEGMDGQQSRVSEDVRYMYEDAGAQTRNYDTMYGYEGVNAVDQQVEGSDETIYIYEDADVQQPDGVNDEFDSSDGIYTPIKDQESDYMPDARQYAPENYFQYVSENGEYLNPQEVPDSYQMTGYAEGYPAERYDPRNVYRYGSSNGESYHYGYSQPSMQQSDYLSNYPYRPEFGYPYENSYVGEYPDSHESEIIGNVDSINEASETENQYGDTYSEMPESWDQFSTTEGSVMMEQTEESLLSDDISAVSEGQDLISAADFESNFKDESQKENVPNDETYYVFDFDESDQTGESGNEPTNYHSEGTDLESFEAEGTNLEKTEDKLKESSDLINNISSHETHFSSQTSSGSELSSKDSDKYEPEKAVSESYVVEGEGNSEKFVPEVDKSYAELGKDSKQPLDDWLSQTFADDPDDEKPVTLSSALERLAGGKQIKTPPRTAFIPNSEAQFLNTMAFPNAMDFASYGYGANTGHNFGMMDSTNAAPFGKTENKLSDPTGNPSLPNLSKLSSLQEKVRSMKRGRFGMFKKYMNSMKIKE